MSWMWGADNAKNEMTIIKGVCPSRHDRTISIGRLLSCAEAEKLCRSEAVIAVTEHYSSDSEYTFGICLSVCGTGPEELKPVLNIPYLPSHCIGKIALIDPAAETLFVSPDLDTVARYTSTREHKIPPISPSPLYSSVYGRVGAYPYLKSGDYDIEAAKCILKLPHTSGDDPEEHLFEKYRDAAEAAPQRATTILSYSKVLRKEEIRAAMRSSIYGNVSLLFGEIRCECELTETLEMLCHVFCELELEGREFNGYLPRGLLIDTPYMLLIAKKLRGLDLIVYDLPSLIKLTIGSNDTPPTEAVSFLCETVCDTAKSRKDIDHRVISAPAIPSDCHRLLLSNGIKDFYADPDKLTAVWNSIEKSLK